MPGASEPATGNTPSVTAIGGAATGSAATGAPSGGTAIGATTGSPSAGNPMSASTGTGPTGTATGGRSAGAAPGGTTAMASDTRIAASAPSMSGTEAEVDLVADMVLARIKDKLDDGGQEAPPEIPSAEHAIALREQAPELYDLWLKIAQEKAATENYVDRAPYEIPERLAASGRPRALGALIIVLSFCGYLAWLGGPGPYIGGLIAILDLGAMFGMFFGLRPEGLPESKRADRQRLLPAVAWASAGA